MSDELEQQFLEAIRSHPEDDEARAVYADWLEERGDPRGEYLRLEMQLHRIPRRLAELVPALSPSWLEAIARLYDVVLYATGASKIMVIKSIREITGLGLKEAKDIADTASPSTPKTLRDGVDRTTGTAMVARFEGTGARVELVSRGSRSPVVFEYTHVISLVSIAPDRKLEAIKLVRELTGLGLKDAKDAVEAVARGTRWAIAHGADDERARQLAARFAGIAQLERD